MLRFLRRTRTQLPAHGKFPPTLSELIITVFWLLVLCSFHIFSIQVIKCMADWHRLAGSLHLPNFKGMSALPISVTGARAFNQYPKI